MVLQNLIIIISVVIATIAAHTLDCVYSLHSYVKLGDLYHCNVNNNEDVFLNKSVTITGIKGGHLTGHKNHDVKAFTVHDKKNFGFLPSGLEKFFPNILLIEVRETSLTDITQENFKSFTSLKHIRLTNNKLERLRANTFALNPKLAEIWLNNNAIVHIDRETFVGRKLSSLRLDNNNCYGRFFNAESEADVERVAKEIEQGHCYNADLAAEYGTIDNLTATIRGQEAKIHGLNGEIKTFVVSLYSLVAVIATMVVVMILLVIAIVVIKCGTN